MWVRIKGVLYNLSLVQSIDFDNVSHSIQLYFTAVIPHNDAGGTYRSDSVYITFDNNKDALLAYKHIIRTIDIPQLKDSRFHD